MNLIEYLKSLGEARVRIIADGFCVRGDAQKITRFGARLLEDLTVVGVDDRDGYETVIHAKK